MAKLYKFLASLKLAVVLLLMLAAILAAATYYESIYDAKTAQHLVYGSPVFAAFLSLLFINIFCSTTIRYPWKRHQLGFVVTHLGILVLLIGSLVTMVSGVDGTLAVREGSTGSRISLDQPVFFYGEGAKALREVDAEFRWNPPSPERPSRIKLDNGMTVLVERYLHHAKAETRYIPDEQAGVAAARVRIHNKRVDVSEWLTLAGGNLPLGPATLKFKRIDDPAEFLGKDWERGERGELQMLVGDQPFRVDVRNLKVGEWTGVPGSPYEIKLVRYLAHAVVQNNELVSKSDEPINPCLELEIRNGKESVQEWLLFSKLTELNTRTKKRGKEWPVRMIYEWESPQGGARVLTLAVDGQNKLYARVDGSAGKPLEVGKPFPTGWMDLEFEVTEFVPRGRALKEYREVTIGKAMEGEGPPPAIQVRFEGSPKPGPHWLERGDVIQIPDNQGKNQIFGYGYRTVDMGFSLLLKDFQIEYDPGTHNPAGYKSQVEVDGKTIEISMNEPMVKNGYKFFQSSYGETDGQPNISIFTVARDPGIALKYAGSIMLVVGIIIMFYMRPHQISRKVRQDEES